MKMWEQRKHYKKFLESLKTKSNKKQRIAYEYGKTYIESGEDYPKYF